MAEDQLYGFIDQSTYDDYDKLHKAANQAVTDITAVTTSAAALSKELNNTKNLNDLTNLLQKVSDANRGMGSSTMVYNDALKKAITLKAQYNGSTNDYLVATKKIIESEKIAAQVTTENIKQQKIQLDYQKALTQEKERIEKAAAKETAALLKNQSAYAQLNAEYKEAAILAKNLGAEEANLKREILELSAINAPSEKVTLAQKQAELLQLAPNLKAAQTNAMGLHTSLLKIDQAVGQSQRNVGNYNGAVTAMSQILREAPSFAYSFSTGLLGISNNIPILVDEIKKLTDANKELVAAGGKAVPVWKTLAQAITSPVGLITIATAAVTIFAARMAMSSNKTDLAAVSLKKYTDALKQADENLLGNAGSEMAKVTALTAVAKDLNSTMTNRLQAVKDLQKDYPDYFASLTKEKILNGEVADAIRQTNNELINNAKAHAYQEKIAITTQRIIELQEAMKDLNKDNPNLKNIGKDNIISGDNVPDAGQKQKAEALKQFNDRKQIKQAEIDDLEKKNAEYAAEVTKFAKLSGSLFLGGGKDTDKSPKEGYSDLLAANKALTEAQAALAKRRFEDDAASQSAIYNNEKETLDKRLAAYDKYQADTVQIAAIEHVKEIALLDDKEREIKQKLTDYNSGKLKLGKSAYQALLVEQKVIAVQRADLEEKFQNDLNGIRLKGQTDYINITKSSTAEWRRVQDEALQETLLTYEASYEQEAKLLTEKYSKALISEETYQKQLHLLRARYNQAEITAQLAEYKKQLENITLSAADRADIEKKITALEKQQAPTIEKQFAFGLSGEQVKHVTDFSNLAIQEIQHVQSAVDARYAAEIAAIEKKMAKVDEAAAAEIEAVKNSSLTQEQQTKRIAEINARAAAEKKKLLHDENEIKRKQWAADKVATVGAIIQRTALAVITALGSFPYTPANIDLAIATGAVGATELALALATKAPAYAEGIGYDGKGTHPGGIALTGEAGRELVIDKGIAQMVDRPTLLDLSTSAMVIPEKDLYRAYMGMLTPQVVNSVVQQQYDYRRLENKLDAVESAIKNQPVVDVVGHYSTIMKVVRKGNSTRTWINNLNK